MRHAKSHALNNEKMSENFTTLSTSLTNQIKSYKALNVSTPQQFISSLPSTSLQHLLQKRTWSIIVYKTTVTWQSSQRQGKVNCMVHSSFIAVNSNLFLVLFICKLTHFSLHFSCLHLILNLSTKYVRFC